MNDKEIIEKLNTVVGEGLNAKEASDFEKALERFKEAVVLQHKLTKNAPINLREGRAKICFRYQNMVTELKKKVDKKPKATTTTVIKTKTIKENEFKCANCEKVKTYEENCGKDESIYFAAKIFNGNLFHVPFHGIYITHRTFKDESHICNQCIRKVGFEAYYVCPCYYCNKKYRPCSFSFSKKKIVSDTAYGCSTFFKGTRGQSNWGSTLDGNVYETISLEFPSDKEVNICDTCTQKLIREEKIKIIGQNWQGLRRSI